MAFYWQIKTFDTYEKMLAWAIKHETMYVMRQVFIENKYGIEYKDLVRIRM